MSSGEPEPNQTWEPLPPRRKRERHAPPETVFIEGESSNVPLDRDNDARSSDKGKENTLEDNIAARSNQVWAKQSLESKDGCAGEFYEYLDHTADVQLHAWGDSLEAAFQNIIPCMFNYLTDLSTVVIDQAKTIEFTVKGSIML